MRTAQPVHSLTPKKFIPRRFSPLYVTVVDEEVEKLFGLCGLTFTDYFAALGCKLSEPVRIVPHWQVTQEPQEAFFGAVKSEVVLFSQSFCLPEYEESDTTDPKLSPYPSRFPSKFHYPSRESMNPPWFKTMVEMLINSVMYSDFDFCDMPTCIIYASLSGTPKKRADEVKKMLSFPQWMMEFVKDIPVVHVVVYDGLIVSKKPDDCSGPKGVFDGLFGLAVRSRKADSPGEIDRVTLRNLFEYDEALMNNSQLCAYLSESDLEVGKKLLKDIATIARTFMDRMMRTHEFEIEKSKELGNRLKGFFGKKAPERLTDYMQIPWKKVVILKLAAMYMITGQYDSARKTYKMFCSSIKDGRFPSLRLFAQLMAALASYIPQGSGAFKEQLVDVIANIAHMKSVRLLLLVPILAMEFHADAGEYIDACAVCRQAISKIRMHWQGNKEMKFLFLALLYERLAGMTQAERTSVFQTARAELCYLEAGEEGHALRCLIWMFRVLPRETWTLLGQDIWYEKAKILCGMKQWSRGLANCKDLLALPNLDLSLHEKVISLFWTPYNDSGLPKDQLQVRVNSLLEVRSLTMIDKTAAEYWGYAPGEFADTIQEFDNWCRTEISKSRSVTFDSWYDSDDTRRSRKQIRSIRVGGQVLLDIGVYNRYKFSVHLDRAVLRADYKGSAPEDQKKYEIEEVLSKNVPGMTNKTTHITFKFSPLVEGTFTVNTFEKNYWGYVDTEIECGPLTFHAVKDYPALSIDVSGMPETAYTGQCQKFDITIKNTGDSVASGLAIVFDSPKTMVPLEHQNLVKLKGLTIMKIPGALDIGETHTVKMVYIAGREGKCLSRFFAASHGIRCAFAKREVVVTSAASFIEKVVPKMNDSSCNVHHCTVVSKVDGFEIVGVMNRNGHLVKSMMIEPGQKLNKGETLSFVAYSSDELETAMEDWRVALMGNSRVSIICKIDGVELPLQRNLGTSSRKATYRLKVAVPPAVTVGEKCECTVRLLSPKNEAYFIEPRKFAHVDATKARVRVPQTEVKTCGCRWLGKTRAVLNKENNYTATFSFKSVQCGVYELQSVVVSEQANFATGVAVPLTTHIRVVTKNGDKL